MPKRPFESDLSREERLRHRAVLREWRGTFPLRWALPRKRVSRGRAVLVLGHRKGVSPAETWRRWWAARLASRTRATQKRHPDRIREPRREQA